VLELKPTWVKCTGSYGVLISGLFWGCKKSGIILNRPFLPLDVVPARERVAGGSCCGMISMPYESRLFCSIGENGEAEATGWPNMSISVNVAVFAREGLGGGRWPWKPPPMAALIGGGGNGFAANGSICGWLRLRGRAFVSIELRGCGCVGVLERGLAGGMSSSKLGVQEAAAAACVDASLSRSAYSWMLSRVGR